MQDPSILITNAAGAKSFWHLYCFSFRESYFGEHKIIEISEHIRPIVDVLDRKLARGRVRKCMIGTVIYREYEDCAVGDYYCSIRRVYVTDAS